MGRFFGDVLHRAGRRRTKRTSTIYSRLTTTGDRQNNTHEEPMGLTAPSLTAPLPHRWTPGTSARLNWMEVSTQHSVLKGVEELRMNPTTWFLMDHAGCPRVFPLALHDRVTRGSSRRASLVFPTGRTHGSENFWHPEVRQLVSWPWVISKAAPTTCRRHKHFFFDGSYIDGICKTTKNDFGFYVKELRPSV